MRDRPGTGHLCTCGRLELGNSCHVRLRAGPGPKVVPCTWDLRFRDWTGPLKVLNLGSGEAAHI